MSTMTWNRLNDQRHVNMRAHADNRRDGLRGHGLCINGSHHGKATHGVRCASCCARHRGLHDLADRLRERWGPRGGKARDESDVHVPTRAFLRHDRKEEFLALSELTAARKAV